MTETPTTSADHCYRHPDRQSYVLCQRCGRTVCPDCQTQAAVGVHCPECVREGRASQPRQRPLLQRMARSTGQPVATYAIIALTALVYVWQLLPGSQVNEYGVYRPVLTVAEPWTMLTAVFLHASVLHILFNMYSLFVFGPILENFLGRARFVGLYLISGFGGSVAVLILSPAIGVVGASGAIFGLMGAFFVIQRRFGGSNAQILIVIGINLLSGFFIPGVAWQAHVGGLVAGAIAALIFVSTAHPGRRSTQLALLGAEVAALIGLTVFGVTLLG